jgi:hypothetical protein
VESESGIRPGVRQFLDPHSGEVFQPIQEAVKIAGLTILAMEFRVVQVEELEGETQQGIEDICICLDRPGRALVGPGFSAKFVSCHELYPAVRPVLAFAWIKGSTGLWSEKESIASFGGPLSSPSSMALSSVSLSRNR